MPSCKTALQRFNALPVYMPLQLDQEVINITANAKESETHFTKSRLANPYKYSQLYRSYRNTCHLSFSNHITKTMFLCDIAAAEHFSIWSITYSKVKKQHSGNITYAMQQKPVNKILIN